MQIHREPRSRLAAGIAVLAAAMAGTLAAACASSPTAPPGTAAPSTTSSPAAAAPAAAPPAHATAESSASGVPRPIETVVPSPEIASQLARVEDVVRRIRGTALRQPVAQEFVTSAGMRALIDNELDDPEAIEMLQEEGRLLEALGLLAPRTDLVETYRALLGDQVVGLYSPERDALYVLAGASPGPVELSTYAHEYHHALQDQRFDLDALSESVKANRDASIALSTLIEGDAVFTQSQYIAQELGPAGALALLGAASAAPRTSAPAVLMDMLQFPYVQGLTFVQSLSSAGGVGAIDAAFLRPPDSTEQVLHPEKFRARETPVVVVLAPRVPEGWTISGDPRGNVLGEYLIRRWLREVGLQAPSAQAVSSGWGGDRYVVAQGPNGSRALIARIAWDTSTDADELVSALMPGPGSEGLRLGAVGRRWAGIVRLDARNLLLIVAADRAAAEILARSAAAG